MARHESYIHAVANARENANDTGETWAVFSDASGVWNAERWRASMAKPSWSGVVYEKILPDLDEETGMGADELANIG